MNPTDLLPRFASASQWLAENHPDAPRLPGWCWLLGDGQIAEHPYTGPAPWDQDDGPASVDNPDACLAGAVVWAMEVAKPINNTQEDWHFSPPMYLDYAGCDDDGANWHKRVWCWSIRDVANKQESHNGEHDDLATACADFLESICTALGRDG